MKPKLSIIIPVYNVEDYLEQCLNSILNQTSLDYEVIVVNDGSTDHCTEICNRYSEQYEIIKVIHKENGGLSSARNTGIQFSNGEYISFVDSDDYVERNYVETIIRNLENNIDLLSFQYKMWKENSFSVLPEKENKDYIFISERECFDFVISDIYKKMNWSAWAHCFKRSLLEQYNLQFEDNKKIFAEDLYFIFCYSSLIKKAKFIRSPIYNYRIRKNSIMDSEIQNLNVGRMNELSKCLLRFYEQSKKEYFIKCFSVIHYCIIRNVLYRALIINNLTQKDFRIKMINDIEDTDFFFAYIKQLIENKKMFFAYFNDENAEYDYSYLKYIYDGSLVKSKIRTMVRMIKKWWKQ